VMTMTDRRAPCCTMYVVLREFPGKELI